MHLSSTTPRQLFHIFHPRYHDRTVLLADYRITTHNVITFPKAASMGGEWYISGIEAKACPEESMKTKSGSTILMRVVPIDDLEPMEPEDISIAEIAKSIKFGDEDA